jgi:ubiquitin-like 1-activating enzyme E1 A
MQRGEASAEEIQRLNPRVAVHHDASRVALKGGSFFQQFDLVIATELELNELVYFLSAWLMLRGQ